MIVICAWCKKHLGEKPAPNVPADAVSHGICPECKASLMSNWKPISPRHDAINLNQEM